jgi:hypothetical protein
MTRNADISLRYSTAADARPVMAHPQRSALFSLVESDSDRSWYGRFRSRRLAADARVSCFAYRATVRLPVRIQEPRKGRHR